MSLRMLERELGFGNGSIAKAGVIPSDRLYAIAKYFNVTMEYLMDGKVNDEPDPNYDYEIEFLDTRFILEISRKCRKLSQRQQRLILDLISSMSNDEVE